MPRFSVWSLRAALLHLGLGFTLGALMLSAPALHLPATIVRLRPLHVESLLVGWMVQLALGVAYWILPRLRGRPTRGSERLAWISLLLLNVGVLAVGVGQMIGAPAGVPLAGRAAETMAALGFARHAWPRARRAY
ncbi:MAG TPA: cbb3-type cytochrome c oxidase subunit I [Gemmatimonadales bacterium]|nr:cbb3-type cytochrome c oxidase subunit I [Gemmatimonadales bacterium]